MKNFSFDDLADTTFPFPVSSFLYRDTGVPVLTNVKETRPAQAPAPESDQRATPSLTVKEIDSLLDAARDEAVAETTKRIAKEYEEKLEANAAKIQQTVELFKAERKSYFSRVESEVVQLALAIASKVLHREAQVDPMLVAALVRMAVDKLHDGSSVSVRVSPAQAEKWTAYLANPLNGSSIAVIEDTHLGPDDCILETDLGSANFSIDAQMKEIEQGFFDLLAQRPVIK
jgi:flagellar assembly protein FliH